MLAMFRKKREEPSIEERPEPTLREALLSQRPSDVLFRWATEGKLREILPDLDALRGISQLPAHKDDAFIHTLKVIDAIEPSPVRRWAAMLHDIGKGPAFIATPDGRSRFFEHDRIGTEMVPDILTQVGEDPVLVEPVQRLVRMHMRPISYSPEWTDAAVRRLSEEAEDGRGEEGWQDLVALSRADLHGYLPEPIDRGLWVLEQLQARRDALLQADLAAQRGEASQPRSPLDGTEILALTNREPGPWIAELKDLLLQKVTAGGLAQGDKDRSREIAREWIASMRVKGVSET